MTTYASSPAENLLAYLPDSVKGFKVARASNTTLTVTAGVCRDSTGIFDMSLASTTTINTAVVGKNGIDTGTFAASTVYAVHVVNDSTGHILPGCIISTSASAPVLPTGYDIFRRIGWAVTDSSTHFLVLVQTGEGMVRRYEFDTMQQILNGGAQIVSTAIDLSAYVPALQDMPIGLSCSITPNTAGNYVKVRQVGSSSTSTPLISGDVKSVATLTPASVLVGLSTGTPEIEYHVSEATDTASIYLQYFVDYL